jgi:hypothetical protein
MRSVTVASDGSILVAANNKVNSHCYICICLCINVIIRVLALFGNYQTDVKEVK